MVKMIGYFLQIFKGQLIGRIDTAKQKQSYSIKEKVWELQANVGRNTEKYFFCVSPLTPSRGRKKWLTQ